MRLFYTILFYLALPFIFLRLLWRSRQNPAYRQHWSERLGYYPQRLDKSIWIHAASVGETLAVIPLVKALRAQYPDLPIVFTTMTISGRARAQAAFGETVYQSYVPYDVPAIAMRFLTRINPVLVLMVETELWPNIFHACEKKQIPIVVANARLSEKSAKGYQRVASITREMLSRIHTLAVQTELESERFYQLGMPRDRVVVTGSIKFDIEPPKDLDVKTRDLRALLGVSRPIWIAASTHDTEEAIVLAAHKKILEKFPDALLILVPRHPERFDIVFHLSQQQFKTVRRSLSDVCTSDTQVYLGDTMGELVLLYSVCDVALVAGSFVPVGGHNMLEAAVLAKPILSGPQLFNFSEISQNLIAKKGMIVVSDADDIAVKIVELFSDPSYKQQTGQNAQAFLVANRGALAKHLSLIRAILPAS